MANVTHEAQQCPDWIIFTLFKWRRRSHTASFSYLKHCTPCDYLHDPGSIESFWTNSIVYCDLFNSSCKAQREKAEQGVGSLKIATCQGELERKRLAELQHHSAGRFFSVQLSHSLLILLSAVQSGECHDILPLGQNYKELPKSGLAGCPPLADFLHIPDGWLYFSPEAVQSENSQGRAPQKLY